MSPKVTLPVGEQEYNASGSKFITMTPDEQAKGSAGYRDIEVHGYDWDTHGESLKVEVTVTTEGIDKGKKDKLSFGVLPGTKNKPSGIFKGKAIYLTLTGKEMPIEKGKVTPNIPEDLLGKKGVGKWVWTEGKKGGQGEPVFYPKLMEILPAGSAPKAIAEVIE